MISSVSLRRLAAVAVLVAALTLGACGGQTAAQKAQQKATAEVCKARADIVKQADSLKGLTFGTSSTAQYQSAFQSIGQDLKAILAVQGPLNEQRKAELQTSLETFVSQMSSVASEALQGGTTQQAQTKMTAAINQFLTSLKQTLGPTNCPS